MLLATDVYYHTDHAKAAGILFDWPDRAPARELTAHATSIQPYRPGLFYERELPCLQLLLAQLDLGEISAIIVDGYVFTDNDGAPGLGAHLYQSIGGACPVIGVAKTRFAGTDRVSIPVLRGQSRNPLYVSAIGADVQEAAAQVAAMHGAYRMPDLLKRLDQLSRE